MKHEYTEKQKETIRGAAMLIMAQLVKVDYGKHFCDNAASTAVIAAESLINELKRKGLCD